MNWRQQKGSSHLISVYNLYLLYCISWKGENKFEIFGTPLQRSQSTYLLLLPFAVTETETWHSIQNQNQGRSNVAIVCICVLGTILLLEVPSPSDLVTEACVLASHRFTVGMGYTACVTQRLCLYSSRLAAACTLTLKPRGTCQLTSVCQSSLPPRYHNCVQVACWEWFWQILSPKLWPHAVC